MRYAAGIALAIVAAAATGFSALAAQSGVTPDAALARFAAAWSQVNTYTCTITAHEVSGTRVQDRTYALKFRKPHDTRMDVTGGDGRGGAAVWHGGDTLRGHQGGLVSFIKLNLSIHDSRASSIRGTTIAEANFGALLEHLQQLKGSAFHVTSDNGTTRIDVAVADPQSDQNVTRELMVLGANDLPVEFDQWEDQTLVKHVAYTDVALNVPLSDSAFDL